MVLDGIEAPETETVIKDWRINVFTDFYRRIDEPSFWGDIKPAGGLSNLIVDKDGNGETVVQWKAGDSIVTPQQKGHFGARIRAHELLLLVPLLPWISIVLACALGIDKIVRCLKWLFGIF